MAVAVAARPADPPAGSGDTQMMPMVKARGLGRMTLRVKLLIGFTLIFTIVFAGTFYWFYNYATSEAESTIKNEMTASLNGAIAGENVDRFVALANDGQKANASGGSDDPLYKQELDWLATVHSLNPQAYPYDYVMGPPGGDAKTVIAVADYFMLQDPNRALHFKEAWHSSSGLSVQGLSQLTYHLVPYTDDWGEWVSAYAPIKDANGKVVGAMGVDYRAEYVDQVRAKVRDQVIAAFAGIYVVLFALMFLVSGWLSKPLRIMTDVAMRIGEGDYNQDLSALLRARFNYEIRVLAEVFQSMVAKVRSREQSLVQQVQQLTIQIDEAKRAKDVSAIVESNDFLGLQEKARQMRARARGATADQAPDTTTIGSGTSA
jgi:hypothetical protein